MVVSWNSGSSSWEKKRKKSSSGIKLQILDKNFGFVCSNNSWATVTTTTTSNIISLLKFKP